MKTKLTERQAEIYRYIKEKISRNGKGPSVREVGLQFGIRSPNGVVQNLKALERKGWITREPQKPRAIQIVENI